MSLAASMSKFKSELSEAATRNLAHSRPSSTAPARTTTPLSGVKRSHDASLSASQPTPSERRPAAVGSELMTHVIYAQEYLKEKFPTAVTFEDILAYLSLPTDLQKHKALIKVALQDHHRVTYMPKSESSIGKELFRYNPIHPVASADELLSYMATRQTFTGISAKELKDVWPDSVAAMDKLERQHKILITRNKRDNTPRTIWADDPDLHAQQDDDFIEFWNKTKLPASETEMRNELEKAGLTPTSQIKEIRKAEPRKKEKRRINRAGGKTTNLHMLGILKDYSKR
ncbi:hypothetical protein AMS68_004927 [Peltaster fructicola]|uniref:Transcription initiation factor IIE subunit beta n=1 Tax=Peltaster fructicola TaxID=286661 RepID=A0A6H0XYB7_9PEZI|nr:hypothetical protein AMS68_004927 [Peltaster fructicola]